MVKVLVQVRELVSSNVGSMVESATDPVKMLRSLRREIEDADVSLHGELAKLRRGEEAAAADASALDRKARDWSDKAKIAMDNDREDLARAALLAREDVKEQAEAKRRDAKEFAKEVKEGDETLNELHDKLAETHARLREHQGQAAAAQQAAHTSTSETSTDKRMDRISALERRVGHAFAAKPDNDTATASPANVEAEIASMRREASVDAELAALKGPKPAKRKARSAKKA